MESSNAAKSRRHPRPRASALILVVAVLASLLAPLQAAAEPFGPGSPEGVAKSDRIRGEFFGMGIEIDYHGAVESWPALDLGSVRAAAWWPSIERTPGVYDWSTLDARIETVEAHGATPLILVLGTPEFHSLSPGTPSEGAPPRLTAFRNLWRALIARYGDRADYQVWNEPSIEDFFAGTPHQMAAMTKVVGQAARDLAPTATVVAPSFPLRGDDPSLRRWFRNYWKQTLGERERPVGDFVDAASISAYPMWDEDPEDGLALTQWATRLVAKHGFDGPMWATEINYGASGLSPTITPIKMNRQVAFVIRTFALHATIGADRVYWWRWEGHRTINTHLNDGTGGLTRAGTAFGVVQDWLLETKPLGCTVTKGVTACGFRPTKGADRYVYWTRSGKVRRIAVPEGAKKQTDPAGVTTSLQPGKRLKVGLMPIMVKARPN